MTLIPTLLALLAYQATDETLRAPAFDEARVGAALQNALDGRRGALSATCGNVSRIVEVEQSDKRLQAALTAFSTRFRHAWADSNGEAGRVGDLAIDQTGQVGPGHADPYCVRNVNFFARLGEYQNSLGQVEGVLSYR